jgi:hypothetical protein
MEEDYVKGGTDWFRIIDLQMEGSSGSPGPSGGKSLSDWAQTELCSNISQIPIMRSRIWKS